MPPGPSKPLRFPLPKGGTSGHNRIMRQAANPFGNIPHALDFFRSASHGKVLQRITSGLQGRSGLLLLTGEIGSGKTTVCKYIQHQFRDNFLFSDIANPFLSREELLSQICRDMGRECPPGTTVKQAVDILEPLLAEHYAAHRTCVLFLDESHLLTKSHFRLLLVLSNLKRDNVPLLQIVMVGQYELLNLLEQPGLEAMNQRIGTRCRLEPLNRQDTVAYVQYKLGRARFVHRNIFDRRSLRRVHTLTGGLPRLINHVCAHAMDQAVMDGKGRVSPDMVEKVFSDPMYTTLLSARTRPPFPWRASFIGAAACLLLVTAGWGGWHLLHSGQSEHAVVHPGAERRDTVRLSADPPPPRPLDRVLAQEQATSRPGVNAQPAAATDQPPAAPKPSQQQPSAQQSTTPPLSLAETTRGQAQETTRTTGGPIQVEETVLPSQTTVETTAEQQAKEAATLQLPDAGDHPELARLTLNAVAWSETPSRRMAVIDGSIRHEGDPAGKATIEYIDRHAVILQLDGSRYALRVNKRQQEQ